MELLLQNLNELEDLAKIILTTFPNARVMGFKGNLGSGKTTIIKGFCLSLGVENGLSSPSFSLVNEYIDKNGNVIYHLDLYRLTSIKEALEIGIEDYLFSGAFCFIEWPELIDSLFPNNSLIINIEGSGFQARKIKVSSA